MLEVYIWFFNKTQFCNYPVPGMNEMIHVRRTYSLCVICCCFFGNSGYGSCINRQLNDDCEDETGTCIVIHKDAHVLDKCSFLYFRDAMFRTVFDTISGWSVASLTECNDIGIVSLDHIWIQITRKTISNNIYKIIYNLIKYKVFINKNNYLN